MYKQVKENKKNIAAVDPTFNVISYESCLSWETHPLLHNAKRMCYNLLSTVIGIMLCIWHNKSRYIF